MRVLIYELWLYAIHADWLFTEAVNERCPVSASFTVL